MDYSKYLSERVQKLPYSGIRKYFDIAAENKEVLSLGIGEPDFDIPNQYKEAGIYHLKHNENKYTSNAGTKELRACLARYLKERFALDYGYEEIFVTSGTSEAMDVVLRAFLAEGDEVIVPSPAYIAYTPDITLAGGTPVIVECKKENKFKLTPELLKAAITKNSKILMLAYPANPTGAIMEKEDYEKLIPIIKEHDLIVITDEVYAELTYGKKHCSFASLPGMKERTVTINGFSKAFAMTGWRIGYVAAPVSIIKQILKIHQYVMMSASTIGQYVAEQALLDGFENDFAEVRKMTEEYDRRRKFLLGEFKKMGLECFEAEGAFYLFPYVGGLGMDGEAFASALLEEEKVAVVPGVGFGESGKDFVRISYAYSMDSLKVACERISRFVSKHKK